MSQLTKKAMQQTFLQLLEKQSLDKITVKDIVENCGINRNTFYYYYKDIYDLLDDLFLEETKRLDTLENSILDWNVMLSHSAAIILSHKKAIKNVYESRSRDVLEGYLYEASQKSIRKYITGKNINKSKLSSENLNFICDFYSHTIVGMVNHWINNDNDVNSEEFLDKMAKILAVSVDASIEAL